jgi:uncharacterized protein (UPF0276 family)
MILRIYGLEGMSMQFAINYSPQAADALRAGELHVDRFKCPPWDDLTAEARAALPIYIHFPLCTGKLDDVDWSGIEAWLARTDTPRLNVHLTLDTAWLPDAAALPERTVAARVTEQYITDLTLLARRFGAQSVIAENVPYRRGGDTLAACVDPAIIAEVLAETDCGLLLDASHAAIAAHGLGWDAAAYIDALPLERTGEVHLTGITADAQGRLRDHMAFTEQDFARAEFALGAVLARGGQPWVVACEYGGVGEKFAWRSEYGVIVHDCARLNAILHGLGARQKL